MPEVDNGDRNLMFGVLALQLELIDRTQFADACSSWAARKEALLAELLVERGWISPADRDDINRVLARKLARHDGDAVACLTATLVLNDVSSIRGLFSNPGLESTLASSSADAVADFNLDRTLAAPSSERVASEIETVALTPEEREESKRRSAANPTLIETFTANGESRDRYTLTRLHAKGGIGQVWMAHDADLGRDVALKELKPGAGNNPMAGTRFLEEARITGQLEHPGIVPVYELATRAGSDHPYYTMRFIRGRTLSAAIRAYHQNRVEGRVDPLEHLALIQAFVAVCNAVAYAHSRGVIHRDLKGQNVVLGDFGEVVVLDWGLAKVIDRPETGNCGGVPLVLPDLGTDREATLQGQVLGTPAYMAPEQAEGRIERINKCTDVYGLGAMLYDILAGQAPFTGGETLNLLRRVREEDPEWPSKINPATPRALEAICRKAMSKDPAHRYGSAAELAREVQRWLADDPVEAYAEPWLVRAGRWARRHRTAVISAAVLLLSALVGLTASTVLIGREQARTERQRRLAEENFRQARRAVDDYFTRVGENTLLNVPGLQPLRKELLESASVYYRDFLHQRGNDPALRADVADSYSRLGGITDAIGSKREALAAHEQARTLYERALQDHPGDARIRLNLARNDDRIGTLLATIGQADAAMRAFDQARSRVEALLHAQPGSSELRRELAMIDVHAATTCRALGRLEQATTAFSRALVVQDSLVREAPDSRKFQSDLVGTLVALAAVQGATARPREAIASYQRARHTLDRLVRAHPREISYQARLAETLLSIGSQQYSAGRPGEALSSWQAARELSDRLARANPTVTQFQVNLAVTENNLAALYHATGKPNEALACLERARDIRGHLAHDNPDVPQFRADLAVSHNNLGNVYSPTGRPGDGLREFEQARVIQERLVREHPRSPDYRSALATTEFNIGAVKALTGHLEEALDAYRRACDLFAALAQEHPTVTLYRSELARRYTNQSAVLINLKRTAEALSAYEQSRKLQDQLVHDDPDNVVYRSDLGVTLNNIGEIRMDQGDYEQARDLYRQAIAQQKRTFAQAPQVIQFRAYLNHHYRNLAKAEHVLKHPEASIAATLERRALRPGNPTELYDIARDLARCLPSLNDETQHGRHQSVCNLVIEILRSAMAAGFEDGTQLLAEPAFNSLRDCAEFEALCMDLAFPRVPFAK